jgi:hypothetical protein
MVSETELELSKTSKEKISPELLVFMEEYNPMRFYSRFRELGMQTTQALSFAKIYEQSYYHNIITYLKWIQQKNAQ